MIIRKTLPEETQRVNELFAIAFELPLESGPAQVQESGVRHWAAFTEANGQMMSCITISDFPIHFDGHRCKMGGVGGVSTLPQYRRMGGIRGCFEACLPDLYHSGYTFSYLYPFSTGYYRKFGFECCVQKLHVTVDLGLWNPQSLTGTVRLCEPNHPMTESIREIDRVWEQRYNMMVIHGEDDYQWTKKLDPAGTLEFTYVYESLDGQPLAYTTFRMVNQPDGRNLMCSRFFFLNREGFSGLMNLFKSLASDHRFVKFILPAGASMEYLLPEWSMGAAQWSVCNGGMVRVVNVKDALEKAAYRGSGDLTIKIQDDQIPENNNCFAVTFQDGKATCVETTNAEPDIIMTIPTFSALLTGVAEFESAAQWMDGLNIKNPHACFCRVFYRKPLMIADAF